MLFVTTCGCKKRQPFIGYTYVGNDGTRSDFVDLHSVRSSGTGVTFSLVSQQSSGQYTVLSILSDCQNHFRRMGGTAYSPDGSFLNSAPPDTQPSSLAADALLKMAASAACGNPILDVPIATGDFDARAALRAVYGNYDPQSRSALWEGMAVPTRPDLSVVRGFSRGVVRVDFDAAYRQIGVDKRIVVTSTKPAGQDYDCHVCLPLLGAVIFSRRSGEWSIESEERYLTLGAPFGELPRYQLVRIGPEKFGVVIQQSDAHQGFEIEWIELIAPEGDTVRTVFTLTTRSDPNEDICSQISGNDESCVRYSIEYHFVPGPNPSYFDILTTKKVIAGAGENSLSTAKFSFVGDKYIPSSAP
ncbi:MAG: hypothetical protein WA875_03145 [Candidatus Acidiferrales bacterium]